MKKLIINLALIVVFTFIGVAQNNSISERNGLFYAGDTPYTGTFVEHYANGETKIEMSLLNGMKNGDVKVYFEDGTINEVRKYRNNKMDGTWVTYGKNHQKIAVANYSNGVKNGKWLIWDEEGNLRYEMHYENGAKVGTWKVYNEEGILTASKDYNVIK